MRNAIFKVAPSAFGGTRTSTASIRISIIAGLVVVALESAASTTTRANIGSSGGSAAARWRASRRQPNTCCGVAPCRRAICETTAPGANVSSTMRAFSSRDHARRRPLPVINSSRRTALGSSLSSSVCTSRSPFQRPKPRKSNQKSECGIKTTLTYDDVGSNVIPKSCRWRSAPNRRRMSKSCSNNNNVV